MKVARMVIVPRILLRELGLPKEAALYSCRLLNPQEAELYIEHSDFPDVADGEPIPVITPTMKREQYDGPLYLDSWGHHGKPGI